MEKLLNFRDQILSETRIFFSLNVQTLKENFLVRNDWKTLKLVIMYINLSILMTR